MAAVAGGVKMSCKYACVCSGNCLRCNSGDQESYSGEAEDIYDEMHGTVNGKQQEEEYDSRAAQEYYEAEYAAYISDLEEEAWREEQFE
jgi:hypothetical protein